MRMKYRPNAPVTQIPAGTVEGGKEKLAAELFKTRAVHFPILRDGRTGMQRAALGKSGSGQLHSYKVG